MSAVADALAALVPPGTDRLLEPFVGCGPVTLAAARDNRARHFVVGDDDSGLIAIWQLVLERPRVLQRGYAELVRAHGFDVDAVRADHRTPRDPSRRLFVLAAAAQWAPDELSAELDRAHLLLKGRSGTLDGDYSLLVRAAQPEDFVYLDPPTERFDEARFREVLATATARGVRWMATTELELDGDVRQVGGMRVVWHG